MYNIFEKDINGKNINHKDMTCILNKETVTEELDNIPADRFAQKVDPFRMKQILAQAEYDYAPNEECDGDCLNDLAKLDITERNEILKQAKREVEYKKRMAELENEEKETKEINKKIRAKTKKRLEEE